MNVPPLRSVWVEWLKNLACAVAVTVSVAAGAVIAASEALEPIPESAIVVLCGAIGRCHSGREPAVAGADEAVAQTSSRAGQ